MMTEHPILFSGPMVRAILEGRKTMTRRVIKPPYEDFFDEWWYAGAHHPQATFMCVSDRTVSQREYKTIRCPYGVPGDRLWVREAWKPNDQCSCYDTCYCPAILYRADYTHDLLAEWKAEGDKGWKPSIHMPRWASRLLLENRRVVPQRLHDITEEDARAEGVSCVAAFRELWDSINGKRSPWDKNDWVWAVTFRRVA